jgi:hypothetical protein
MTIKISDGSMTSDRNPHTAELWPMPDAAESPTMWRVSWLPGKPLRRNEATTAMVIADVVGRDGIDSTHRNWPFVTNWAAELGMGPADAVRAATAEPERGGGTVTTLQRDIAPDSEPETDECGFCGVRYAVRDRVYGVCPQHEPLPSYTPEAGEMGPSNLYWEAGQ